MSEQLTHGTGLAKSSLNAIEVLAQSVSTIGPSATIAFVPGAILAVAGYGAWLSFTLGSVGIFAVALCVCVFARRRASVGSLYALARLAVGSIPTFAAGWSLLVGMITICSGTLVFNGFIVSLFGASIGIGGLGQIGWQLAIDTVLFAGSVALAVTGVRRMLNWAAAVEVVSILIILVVLVGVYIKTGHVFDSRQLSLKGVTLKGVFEGVVFAFLGLIGFESAASLGEEAKNPGRAVPNAILRSVILAAVLYIFATYTITLAFTSPASAASNGNPLGALADFAGLSFLHGFIYLGIAVSLTIGIGGFVNVIGRLLLGMSREGVMPPLFGRTHRRYKTPHVGMLASVAVILPPSLILIANGDPPASVTGWLTSIGVYGYMVTYAVICIGAPLFAKRVARPRGVGHVGIAAGVGVAALGYTFYKQLFPAPPYPLNILPYIFLGCLVLGLLGFGWLLLVRPDSARNAGTYADDLPDPAPALSAPAATPDEAVVPAGNLLER
jgi:amino acid transporter